MDAPRFVEQAPWESGFAAVYEREIQPALTALEARRQAALSRFWKLLALLLVAVLAIWVLLYSTGANGLVLGIVVPVGALVAGLIIVFNVGRGYEQALRDAVMPPVCRFLGDLAYQRKDVSGDIDPRRLADVGLLPRGSIRLEDYFAGRWRDTAWEMVELRLSRRSRNSKGGSSEKTVYRGLILRIAVPIDFAGIVVVSRDIGSLGNELRSLLKLGSRLQGVPVPHPAFEKAFEVFTDGQADVPRLLSGPVLEALLQLDQVRGGKGLTAAFADGAFFVALPVRQNLFEFGSLFRPAERIEADLHALLFQATLPRRIIDALHGDKPDQVI